MLNMSSFHDPAGSIFRYKPLKTGFSGKNTKIIRIIKLPVYCPCATLIFDNTAKRENNEVSPQVAPELYEALDVYNENMNDYAARYVERDTLNSLIHFINAAGKLIRLNSLNDLLWAKPDFRSGGTLT